MVRLVAEALTATYLAYQLREHDFFVYPQLQCSNQIENHLDLAAVNRESRTVPLAEAKRLFSSEKAALLGQDWRRLQTATITSPLRHIPDDHRYFALLLATTWKETYRDWWQDPKRSGTPTLKRSSEDWADLKDALDQAQVNLAVH